jgi:hypothetical protein
VVWKPFDGLLTMIMEVDELGKLNIIKLMVWKL